MINLWHLGNDTDSNFLFAEAWQFQEVQLGQKKNPFLILSKLDYNMSRVPYLLQLHVCLFVCLPRSRLCL